MKQKEPKIKFKNEAIASLTSKSSVKGADLLSDLSVTFLV
jgi:hypothetical protein